MVNNFYPFHGIHFIQSILDKISADQMTTSQSIAYTNGFCCWILFLCSSDICISLHLRLCFVFCFFLHFCLFYFVDFCPVSFHFSLFRFFLLCTKRSDFLQLYPKLTGQWASCWDLILHFFGLEMSKLFYSLFSVFYFFKIFCIKIHSFRKHCLIDNDKCFDQIIMYEQNSFKFQILIFEIPHF